MAAAAEKKRADKKSDILIYATLLFGFVILLSRFNEDGHNGSAWKKIGGIVEFIAAAFYICLDQIVLKLFG